jgi:PKD repeat protein
MINKLLYLTALIFSFGIANAQTTLFSETFDGASPAFTLNTADQSSSVGTGGSNFWVVNNNYAGGSGSLICFGFPFNFTIPATASQPAGITNNPNSKYLHITSSAAASSSIFNACFTASDGLCNFDENNFAKMTNDISTIGFDSVEVSFYWLCAGGAQSYGEVYASINGGSTWQLISAPTAQYSGSSSWTQQKISTALFAQKSSLRFGFRFVNAQTTTTSDPAFSVDDINIKGFTSVPASTVSAPTFTGTSFCPGDAMTINFTSSGAFNSGNVFTAQLSNASGSFASPTAIGSLTAQAAGPISAVIPFGTAAGTGYRIRVVSGNPVVTGADNGINISVASGPTAGVAGVGLDTVCAGTSTTVTLTGVVGTPIWEESTNGTSYTGSTYTGNSFNTGLLNQSTYLRAIVQNSCGRDTSNVVFIFVNPTPNASFTPVQSGSSLAVTFTNSSTGSFVSTSWSFGDGNSSSATSPTHTYATTGLYGVTLIVTSAEGCSSSYTDSVNVNAVAVNNFENNEFQFSVYPNPTKGQFNIDMTIDQAQDMQINLIDINGRRMETIFNGFMNSGIQNIRIEKNFAAGIYFIEMICSTGRTVQKLMLQ